jgi:hypothetical protein
VAKRPFDDLAEASLSILKLPSVHCSDTHKLWPFSQNYSERNGYSDREILPAALRHVRKLLTLDPGTAQLRALLSKLERRLAGNPRVPGRESSVALAPPSMSAKIRSPVQILAKMDSHVSRQLRSSLRRRQPGERPGDKKCRAAPPRYSANRKILRLPCARRAASGCSSPGAAGFGRGSPSQPAPMALSATDEQLPRIAVVAVPGDTILLSLPRDKDSAGICGGITIEAGDIVTLGAGQRSFTRIDGLCRWASIWLPAPEFTRYEQRGCGQWSVHRRHWRERATRHQPPRPAQPQTLLRIGHDCPQCQKGPLPTMRA